MVRLPAMKSKSCEIVAENFCRKRIKFSSAMLVKINIDYFSNSITILHLKKMYFIFLHFFIYDLGVSSKRSDMKEPGFERGKF